MNLGELRRAIGALEGDDETPVTVLVQRADKTAAIVDVRQGTVGNDQGHVKGYVVLEVEEDHRSVDIDWRRLVDGGRSVSVEIPLPDYRVARINAAAGARLVDEDADGNAYVCSGWLSVDYRLRTYLCGLHTTGKLKGQPNIYDLLWDVQSLGL